MLSTHLGLPYSAPLLSSSGFLSDCLDNIEVHKRQDIRAFESWDGLMFTSVTLTLDQLCVHCELNSHIASDFFFLMFCT